MTDSQADASRELPGDYILADKSRGTNQFLSVPQHDAPEVVEIVAGEGSKIQAGQLPGISGPAFSSQATKANPIGNSFSESLNQ